jgi:hypothetical protein
MTEDIKKLVEVFKGLVMPREGRAGVPAYDKGRLDVRREFK